MNVNCTCVCSIKLYWKRKKTRKKESKLSQIAYNDIKWNENKALRSKKIKSLFEQIGLGELWMIAHYADIGIVNMIRQRLKDDRTTKMAE